MGCSVVKVFNNNVLLAQDDERQIVVISKGVGFNRRKGDDLSLSDIDEDSRIFHILENGQRESDLGHISHNIEEMERIAHETVGLAKERLSISDSDGRLFEALFDHISFSIERLKVGLPIENPFIMEIGVLCRDEYPVAQAAAAMVRERMAVEMGESEVGFIALHLYSARRQNPVGAAMKSVRIFSQALDILSESYNREFQRQRGEVTAFLTLLSGYVALASEGKVLEMPLKSQVKLSLNKAYGVAEKIAGMIADDMGVTLDMDAVAFLSVDVHRLSQVE